ncbi:hypothetical protein L345_05897, partial [Ophiophagus hannah]
MPVISENDCNGSKRSGHISNNSYLSKGGKRLTSLLLSILFLYHQQTVHQKTKYKIAGQIGNRTNPCREQASFRADHSPQIIFLFYNIWQRI